MKNYQQREWLIEHYVNRQLSVQACAEASEHNVTGAAVHRWLRVHDIPIRARSSHMKGERNPRRGKPTPEETKRKIAKALTGKKRSLGSRIKQSERMKGMGNHQFGKRRTEITAAWTVDYLGREFKMRGRWEVLFADWLAANGKAWDHEPETFILPDGSAFTPDFLSEGVYYEVKGWLSRTEEFKVQMFRSTYPDKVLILIDRAEMENRGIDVRTRKVDTTHIRAVGPDFHSCAHCGVGFNPTRKGRTFCSLRCSASGPRKGIIFLVCEVCGKRAKVFPSELKRRHTCSPECGRILGAKKRSGDRHWTANH